MTRLRLLALFAIFEAVHLTPVVGASRHVNPTEQKPLELRSPPPNAHAKRNLLLRQDLFDRGNSNNVRSDWPAPPAQPGQF